MYFLYVTRALGLAPGAIGLIFGMGSGGALLGSLVAYRVARVIGLGRTIIGAHVVLGMAVFLIVLPQWLPGVALPLLVAAEFVLSCVSTLSGINRVSVMQVLTPNRLLGRVWASISFIGLGVVPVGAFVGGALGGRIGVPATILVCACGGLPSFVWHLCSPVRHLRELPLPVEDVPGGPPA